MKSSTTFWKALTVAALLVSLIALGMLATQRLAPSPESATIKATLYVGLNDKDTNTQLVDRDQAQQLLEDICAKYLDGYTIFDARGGWVDSSGTRFSENTLICETLGQDEKDLIAVAEEVKSALNQESVLMVKERVEQSYL